MVLSNKKLKQKLRAELLVKRVSESEPDEKTPDSNSEPYSLKSLLDSVTQKPRLSKREKRRKILPFSSGMNQETEENGMEVDEDEEKGNSEGKRDEGKVKAGKTTSENKETNKKRKQKNANEEHEVLEVENGSESLREDVATKVYVGGIPYRYTEDDIRYYFGSSEELQFLVSRQKRQQKKPWPLIELKWVECS